MKVVKMFLLICGVLIVGGCSSGERGEEKDVSPSHYLMNSMKLYNSSLVAGRLKVW